MNSNFKLYKVKDFIRKNETGAIDLEKSKQIVRELATAALFHQDHNILIDMRDTSLIHDQTIGDLLELALEMASYKSVFTGKIANVLPDDTKRLARAQQLKAALEIQGFSYEVFTTFENAINWLSETRDISRASPN
jgi:hypothetical protein